MCGSGLTIRGGATDVDLGVVGIYVDSNSTCHGNSDDICRIKNKKERSEDRTLRHTTRQLALWGRPASVGHSLGPSCQKRGEPPKCLPPYTVRHLQSMQEDVMVDGVESGAHVEQAEQGYLLTVSSVDDVRDDLNQCCLGRVPWSICRLERWHRI